MAFLAATPLHSSRSGFFGRSNMLNVSLTQQRVATPSASLVVYAGRIVRVLVWLELVSYLATLLTSLHMNNLTIKLMEKEFMMNVGTW